MSEVKIGSYIVPWALPNEKIPMHVTWSAGVLFDEIHVKIPSEFELIEVLNVDESELRGHEAIIRRVKPHIKGVPNYFGMVLRAPRIFEELRVARKIAVEFIREEKVFYCLELYSHIFRPRLENLKSPKEIELTDYRERNRLPLNLRYIGFGDIELRIEARIQGKLVSMGESLIYELLKRLWLSDVLVKEADADGKVIDSEREERKRELWIEPSYIRRMAEEVHERLEKGRISTDILDEEAVAGLKEWLADLKKREKFMEILYEKTEEMMLGLLLDLFEKNPTNNVKLENAKTVVRAKFKTPVTEITLKLVYKDKIGNIYEPIEIPISIKDLRTEKSGALIEIPILVENWQNEPFMNVGKMTSEEK